MKNEEFYVGYLPKAPTNLARRVGVIAAMLVVGSLVVGFILTRDQPPFANSRFEFGVYRDYSGVIEEWPYPMLRSVDSSFLLVGPGKHGFSKAVRGWQGKNVQLQGSLIERGPNRMLEVVPASLHEIAGPLASARGSVTSSERRPPGSGVRELKLIDLGPVTLRGEIVDTKCYFGVMNPGNGKVHRDCAARCIGGGAPPAFVARDAEGDARVLLLVGSDGRQLTREVLPFVAEPIEVSGELVHSGANLILKSEPSSFRRME